MDINDMKFGDLKKIAEMFSPKSGSSKSTNYEIGRSYLIRTVTHIQIGTLIEINDENLVLSPSVWVADTGRFFDCLKNGVEALGSSEIEPYINPSNCARGGIIDSTEYNHNIPTEQK